MPSAASSVCRPPFPPRDPPPPYPALNLSPAPIIVSSTSYRRFCDYKSQSPPPTRPRPCPPLRALPSPAATAMEGQERAEAPMKLLFVEMGVGYDQHGQDITAAAVRACRDAISSNSIPAFRRGSIPGVNTDQMKLQLKLGVPHSTQQFLDIERVKSVFPYGKIVNIEIVDGGLICSSGVCLEAMGDKNDDCYVVNAAVYVGY